MSRKTSKKDSMNENFKTVAENLTDKKLQKTAISLSAKYKPTVAKELERANWFANQLFFKNNENEALKIIEVLEAEQFNGNYNLWTYIQSALLLKCWILEKKDKQLNQQNIENSIEKINSTLEFWNNDEMKKIINTRARNRRLTGSLLHYDKIEKAVAENDRQTELAWRIGHFLELLFIYFLGDSEQFPTEKALTELEENESIIKQII